MTVNRFITNTVQKNKRDKSIYHSKNRNAVMAKSMLFQLVRNVVYDNFQDILVLGAIQCSREFLKSISIHFNCSFM